MIYLFLLCLLPITIRAISPEDVSKILCNDIDCDIARLTWNCDRNYMEFNYTNYFIPNTYDVLLTSPDFVPVDVTIRGTTSPINCNEVLVYFLQNEQIVNITKMNQSCIYQVEEYGTYRPQQIGDFTLVFALKNLTFVNSTLIQIERNLLPLTPAFAALFIAYEADTTTLLLELQPSYITPCYTFPERFRTVDNKLFTFQGIEDARYGLLISKTYELKNTKPNEIISINSTHEVWIFVIDAPTLFAKTVYEYSYRKPITKLEEIMKLYQDIPIVSNTNYWSGLSVVLLTISLQFIIVLIVSFFFPTNVPIKNPKKKI
jgi:hypothetical protein